MNETFRLQNGATSVNVIANYNAYMGDLSFSHVTWWLLWNDKRWLANQPAGCSTIPRQSPAFQKSEVGIHASGLGLFDVHEDQRDRAG